MGGMQWTINHNWGNGDPCLPAINGPWYGVGCYNPCMDGIEGVACGRARVRSLLMGSNNLHGSIPPNLFAAMQNLSVIDLSHNVLSGTIPRTLGLLRNVRDLLLESNTLSGTLPTQVGLLGAGSRTTATNFTQLIDDGNVSKNITLRSILKTEVIAPGNQSYTAKLSLATNHLSGVIPTELGRLLALECVLLHPMHMCLLCVSCALQS